MIEVEQGQGFRIARVKVRRIDAAETPRFRGASADAAGAGDRLLLDLSEVDFVDSTGLGAIVSIMKSLGPTGELHVAGAKPAVRRLFELTRLDRVIKTHPTVDAATAALTA